MISPSGSGQAPLGAATPDGAASCWSLSRGADLPLRIAFLSSGAPEERKGPDLGCFGAPSHVGIPSTLTRRLAGGRPLRVSPPGAGPRSLSRTPPGRGRAAGPEPRAATRSAASMASTARTHASTGWTGSGKHQARCRVGAERMLAPTGRVRGCGDAGAGRARCATRSGLCLGQLPLPPSSPRSAMCVDRSDVLPPHSTRARP